MNLSPTAWIEAFEKYLGQTKGWLAMNERVKALEARLATLERQLAAPQRNEVCDHCGGHHLTRTGTRKMGGAFARLGEREALFVCADCGKETAVELP
jgi:predicted RNA-binding Zn-ribbon protein involved in translation (DUF1610 family)